MTSTKEELIEALDSAIAALRTAEDLAADHDPPHAFARDAIGFGLNGALTAKDRIVTFKANEDMRDDNSLAGQLIDLENMARSMRLDLAADAIRKIRRDAPRSAESEAS